MRGGVYRGASDGIHNVIIRKFRVKEKSMANVMGFFYRMQWSFQFLAVVFWRDMHRVGQLIYFSMSGTIGILSYRHRIICIIHFRCLIGLLYQTIGIDL